MRAFHIRIGEEGFGFAHLGGGWLSLTYSTGDFKQHFIVEEHKAVSWLFQNGFTEITPTLPQG